MVKTKMFNVRMEEELLAQAKSVEKYTNFKLNEFIRERINDFIKLGHSQNLIILRNLSVCAHCGSQIKDIEKEATFTEDLKYRGIAPNEKIDKLIIRSYCCNCIGEIPKTIDQLSIFTFHNYSDDEEHLEMGKLIDYGIPGTLNMINDGSWKVLSVKPSELIVYEE